MRILAVSQFLTPAVRTIEVALSLGHEVCLIGNHNPFQQPRFKGYHFSPSNVTSQPDLDLQASRERPETYRRFVREQADQLVDAVAWFQPHLVHAFGLQFDLESCIAARLRPLIVSAFGYLNFLLEQPHRADQILDEKYNDFQGVDAVLLESDLHLAAYRKYPQLAPTAEQFILGVNGRNFKPGSTSMVAAWRKALGFPADAFVVLSPRGWSKIYNHAAVLKAFATIYRALPQPAYLAFLTLSRSPTPDYLECIAEVKTLAKDLQIDHAVGWLKPLPYEMMPIAYNISQLAVNYPVTDAFPMTLLEALACQIPVVSVDLPSYSC